MRRTLLIVIALYGTTGCTPKTVKPSQLVTWVEDESNGLRMKQAVGPISFDLQYQPVDYLVAIQEKLESIPVNVYNEAKEQKSGSYYFRLRLQKKDGNGDLIKGLSNDYAEYSKLVEYLSFDMQHDFTLIDGADSVACSLYHFERSYQAAPYSTILLGFEKSKKSNPEKTGLKVFYDDKILSIGQVTFSIKPGAISEIPSLKTSQK